MKNPLNGSSSTAISLATDAARGVRSGLGRALTAITTGVSLIGLRDAGRDVVRSARRNPVTTAAAVTAAVGAGVALWVLRKSRQRTNGSVHKAGDPIEVEPIRVERSPRRAARKTAARKSAAEKASASNSATH